MVFIVLIFSISNYLYVVLNFSQVERHCACVLSHFSHVWLSVTPWILPVSSAERFSRHEYWNGLPSFLPGDLSDPGIKIARRNINNLRYADNITLMAESEEELKSLLMKVEEESEKVDLKLNIQKTKIMASGPITSWQIDGETVETVTDFMFLGSKIIAHGDCSHEIKRHWHLWREVMTNLESILKSRDITLLIKVHLIKVFHTVYVVSRQEYWSGLPFPSPVYHILSDLSTMTRPSWVAPHGMA